MSEPVRSAKTEVKGKAIFPGVWMLIAGGIIDFWGAGIYIYSTGIYLTALTSTFGWTRAQVSLAYSFARLEGGIEGPIAGMGIDKWGPKVMNYIGVTLLGVGFILMYFINSLWMFYVLWLITSVGFNAGFIHALDTALANWYVKKRGFMIALMRSAVAFSGLTVLPLIAWLINSFGVQIAFFILGIATLAIGIPLTYFFVKPLRPEYYGWLPDGEKIEEAKAKDTEAVIQQGIEYAAGHQEVEFTLRQAMKGRIYWIFILLGTFNGMIFPVISIHTIPYLIDIGIDNMVAAAAMGTLVFMTLPGRLIFGWFGDMISLDHLRYMKAFATLIQVIGLFFLIYAQNMSWIWAFLVIFGIGQGGNIALSPPMRGRFWGRKAYATIQGSMQAFTMPVGLIAPVYAGWLFDTTGSYAIAFNLTFVFAILATLFTLLLVLPKPPEVVTSIDQFV